MRTLYTVCGVLGAALALGCSAGVPPQDLVNARSAYHRATNGPTAQHAQADMHAAKEQLDVAEAAYERDGDSQRTRDEAYLSVRKTEIAESHGRAMIANQTRSGVVSDMHDAQGRTVAATAAELRRSQEALASKGGELETERERRAEADKARAEAEKRAAQAAADLAKFASVKEEARGLKQHGIRATRDPWPI